MNQSLYFTNVSLAKFNSLHLEARAAHVYFPLNAAHMVETIKQTQGKKRILLGTGSNVLLNKATYDESYAFIITTMMDNLIEANGELVVEAGVSLHQLAWYAIEHSYSGYEFCEDIPGTVGGALVMNAGQFEFTIGPLVHWIDVIDSETLHQERIIPKGDFFGYRTSKFKPTQLILACGLELQSGNDLESLEKVLTYKRERYRKQPRNYPNAGSVFKRPTKDGQTYYVWKLFEALGLRGYRLGGAEISMKHPGFIVNVDHATIEDVQALIQLCQTRVKKQFDLDLELEWKTIE